MVRSDRHHRTRSIQHEFRRGSSLSVVPRTSQDKLELGSFTVNAGLRLDYSSSNVDWYAVSAFEQSFFSSKYDESTVYPTVRSTPQWQISPRLGIAHPISENAKLFFNYGHFKQLPQYETLFRIQRTSQNSMSSYGDPNIFLAKTISYELGFDYVLWEDYLVQVAGFYNDISDQQDFTEIYGTVGGFTYTQTSCQPLRGYPRVRVYDSQEHRPVVDRICQFHLPGDKCAGTSAARGSTTTPGDQARWDAQTTNLYQDRPIPQPYARVNLALRTPDDYGFTLFGHHLLGGWALNTVFDWQAGYWTTWNPNGLPYVAYNVKAVDYYNLYLRLEKNMDIAMFKLQLFMDVNNLLNTHRLWGTNDQAYMTSLHLPKSPDYSNIPGDDKVGDYRNARRCVSADGERRGFHADRAHRRDLLSRLKRELLRVCQQPVAAG